MSQKTKAHFLVGTVILGFLSIFKKSQASSTFEDLYSVFLSRYQSDVIPPIHMRQRTMAFSRVSTGDSDIPSSCEMQHEPEFKPLPGRPAFFWVRVSQGLFHLRQNTGSLSHTYCWAKTPLDVLVENWLKSSIKDRSSALILGRYGVHGTFLELLYWY